MKDKQLIKNNFLNDIKIDTRDINKFVYKKKFLEYIDGNIEALNLLSINRLKKLKEYYNEIIENNDKIIEKLMSKKEKTVEKIPPM